MVDIYTFTIVNDTDGSFRVHRKACPDTIRRKGGVKNGEYDVRAESAQAAVRNEIASLNEEFGGSAFDESNFVILPCAEYVHKWQGRTVEQ